MAKTKKKEVTKVMVVLGIVALLLVILIFNQVNKAPTFFAGENPKNELTYNIQTDKTCNAEADCRQYYESYGVSSGLCVEGKCVISVVVEVPK